MTIPKEPEQISVNPPLSLSCSDTKLAAKCRTAEFMSHFFKMSGVYANGKTFEFSKELSTRDM